MKAVLFPFWFFFLNFFPTFVITAFRIHHFHEAAYEYEYIYNEDNLDNTLRRDWLIDGISAERDEYGNWKCIVLICSKKWNKCRFTIILVRKLHESTDY